MIDTQLHLVDPERFPIPRDSRGYVPGAGETGDLDALLAAMDRAGVERGVLVQPSCYDTDNRALLHALDRHPARFRAVVMTEHPSDWATRPGVRGVRINATDYAAHAGGAHDTAAEALRAGLVLQLQAFPRDLAGLVDGLPDGPVVIDHMGRPADAADAERVAALATRADTYLKVSGGFRFGAWPVAPGWARELAAAFGPDRLLWGSDWPMLNAAERPSMTEAMRWAASIADLDAASANAARLFGFDG